MENYDLIGETEEENGIFIKGKKYSYSIIRSENEEDSIIIKLFDQNKKSTKYFTYEAPSQKLRNDIKFLSLCENLDEIIISLNNIFSEGNAKDEENNGQFYLELKFVVTGIAKKSIIQLTEHDPEKPKRELEIKIDKLENKYKELFNKYEELKKFQENNIRNIVKEVIFDKNIKNKLFEEFEQFQNNSNKIDNNRNINEKLENDLLNKAQNEINNKEEKINNEIKNIQE